MPLGNNLKLYDHNHNRKNFYWTSFGRNGDEPPNSQRLDKLSDNHIRAILKNVPHIAGSYIEELLEQELLLRKIHNTTNKEAK